MRAKGRRYPSAVPAARSLRNRGSWAFGVAGNLAHMASQRLAAHDGRPTLAGDRWIEWSFCMARLAQRTGNDT